MLIHTYNKVKKSAVLFGALLVVALTSCVGGSSAADELNHAERAIAFGDVSTALDVVKNLVDRNDVDNLPASQIARLSMIYMHIADSTDRENNIAQAADFYRMAYEADADSAASYYATVDMEEYPYVTMLKTLVSGIDNPCSPESDSIEDMSECCVEPLITDSI